MFEEGSLAARLIIIVLVTVGVAAIWYQGRRWNDGLRLWHGVVLGLIAGVFVAYRDVE